jgi:uncharacterized membrane protein
VRAVDTLMKVVAVLPWLDWVALGVFLAGYLGYVRFAKRHAATRPSILASTNRIRRQWMLQATYREVRVFDGVVVQNLSTSPSFFASTTILIIGGLLATLGTTEKASSLVQELPFAARTTALVFDLKLSVLLAVFVYAFFRFTWSLRQYSFGALLVAAAPEARQLDALPDGGRAEREAFADRAGQVVGLAAETFNDGLRAYYFAFALVCWFFSPAAMMLGTAGIVTILYQREFRSEALAVLNR